MARGRGVGEMLAKGPKPPVIRGINSEDLIIYRMVTVVNNILLCT